MSSWKYKLQSWDPPEIQQFLKNAPESEVTSDEMEIKTVSQRVDGEVAQSPSVIKITSQGLLIGGREIASSQLRCITTKTGVLSSMASTLLLSCRQVDGVTFYFLHQPDPATAVAILNKFRETQSRSLPNEFHEQHIYDYFVPKVICKCDVEIEVFSTHEVSTKSYFVSLDEECLCLFSEEFQTAPVFRVIFQKEDGDHVVEKMSVSHIDGKFNIETVLNRYSMDGSNPEVKQLVNEIKRIKPKPKTCFKDLSGTLTYLRHRDPTPSSAPSSARTHVARQSDSSRNVPTFTDSYTRDEDDVIVESARLFYRGFKDDLESAYREGETNPDWQMLWAPYDAGLKEVLELNLVSQRDARSGGLNPNDISHFQTSLSTIDDQLFSQEYEAVVSSLRSMREVFSESSYPEVRPILADGDYILLRKLFYYFLKNQAS